MAAVLAEVNRVHLRHHSGRPHLANTAKYPPSTGFWHQGDLRTSRLQKEHRTVFVIICLCYEGLEWPEGGLMEMVGPKHDLLLFLSHLKYRHRNDNREFLIYTDFDADFKDHTGFTAPIRRIPATRNTLVRPKATANAKHEADDDPLRKATHIQATMQSLDREDKCVLYYSGHIEVDSQNTHDGSAHILLRENERIYDHELRGWLQQSRFSTTSIIAIFDACFSGGFLGLPYVHSKNENHMNKTDKAHEQQMTSHVIEIASTAKDQLSFGKKFKGNTQGILTWHLLQYLEVNPRASLYDLGSHIYSECDTRWVDGQKHEWRQVPVLSCSRNINEATALLESVLAWHLLQCLKVNPQPVLHELVAHIYSV
ncbi:hypothetical protein FRC01_007612, partial [Tulasnella sp. 417]